MKLLKTETGSVLVCQTLHVVVILVLKVGFGWGYGIAMAAALKTEHRFYPLFENPVSTL
jgi:hypothetical protein